MAIELMVMPLSRYVAGDFVTPAMRRAWESGSPYRCQSPEGPRELKPNVPWGGGGARHLRDSVQAPLDTWLANLPAPLPQQRWDERSDLPPRFHRLDVLSGDEAFSYAAFRSQAAARRPTGRPLFGIDLPEPAGRRSHSGAALFLPREFDLPFEMTAPMMKATGSAVLALRELEQGPCPAHARRPRDVLLAALRDAIELSLPLVLVDVDDAPPPTSTRRAAKAARPTPPAPVPGLPDEVWHEVHQLVGAGFDNHASLMDRIVATMGEALGIGDDVTDGSQLDDETRALLGDAIRQAFVQRFDEMPTWPAVTDCERLQAAFAALGRQGIVALENCGVTQKDGCDRAAQVALVQDELGAVVHDGYCFCHAQDVAHAVAGGGLCLAFGSFRPERGDHPRVVGEAVVRACLDQGLAVDWNRSPDTRIVLPTFSWQRRLVRTQDADVREFIASWEAEVRGGYTPAEELHAVLEERARDWFAGFADYGDDLLRRLRDHTETFLRAEQAREAAWAEPTINDRVTAAFQELTKQGVLAAECSGLTIQDGWGYAGLDAKPTDRGVVFFHRDDVVDGMDGRGLLLAYDVVGTPSSTDDAAAAALAREIVDVLRSYAVPCTWSGSTAERIRISPFAWRKRRWTTAPELHRAPSSPPKPASLWSRMVGRLAARPRTGRAELGSAARRAAVVVTAVRDERRFDLRRSRQMRAAWQAIGGDGDGQMGHLGRPHVFVPAGELTTVLPCAATENLRAQQVDAFLLGSRIRRDGGRPPEP